MEAKSDPKAFIQCFRLPHFDVNLSESEVDAHGEPVRHRRSRGKSKTGCEKCKERRVKCDEKRPSCWNCTKLGLHCNFIKDAQIETARDPPNGSAPLQTSNKERSDQNLGILPQPVSSGIYPPLNMSHMHLFHHFSTVTSGTLAVDNKLWKEKVIPSAFKHEYLMHAILVMTASHLRHLQPQERQYHQQELEHFSQVIPAFNAALSQPVTGDNLYSLAACSLLILQYAWACPDLTNRDVDNAVDFGFGSLTGLYSGMRNLGMSLLAVHDPYLHSVMFHRPIETIKQYSESSHVPGELEDFFTHCCQCPQWRGSGDENFSIRMEAAHRLVPILSALRLGEKELEASGLMPDISRYLFALPLFTSGAYAELLRNNDEPSLVILLYYFSLVRRLLGERFWWMRERSAHLCVWLLAKLGDKCERCVGWARDISTMQPL
ncbi:hypothetical protein L207DRAFT_464292 [Hyaloscypha variabilis F]|uniref:Zn(2)-C6 fungal-type domain-containing protein n=1 Tax=Hyaloscypha variabilis (strain UAMH 11265 / GT02V1 / F) TaxID=1149755 RepID=A0A2J6RH34_HYAVF|nr:hypothetical protein L207DRAFT_464292 [Hyaloscypha variabilis F]